MNKIKVLMIDDNVQLIEAVKEYFKGSKLIEIYDSAYDGVEGIKKIDSGNGYYDVYVKYVDNDINYIYRFDIMDDNRLVISNLSVGE